MDKELESLPAYGRARLARMSELIAAAGFDRLGTPHIKYLTGSIWEMRMKGKDGISCALYVTVRNKRVVVVKVFVKKTQKTRREIDLALLRAKEGLE